MLLNSRNDPKETTTKPLKKCPHMQNLPDFSETPPLPLTVKICYAGLKCFVDIPLLLSELFHCLKFYSK